jgi:hypothetical protein
MVAGMPVQPVEPDTDGERVSERMVGAVARLEEAGWVRRESCPTDRRGSFARLTDEGFEALAAAAPGHVASVRAHLIDRLTREQIVQLRDISETIVAGLRGFEPGQVDPATLSPVTVEPARDEGACPEAG